MSDTSAPAAKPSRGRSGMRLWHLSATIAIVALTAALIHEGRMRDPWLIAIAASGFLGWCVWFGLGIPWLDRGLRTIDRVADPRRRRRLRVAAFLLFMLTPAVLLVIGLGILVAIQLRFFPHAL